MLREYNYILSKVNMAADFALGAAAFLIAHAVRRALSIYVAPQWIAPSGLLDYGWTPLALPFITVAALGYNRFYRSQRLEWRLGELLRRLAVSCIQITTALVIIIYFFNRGDIVSRPLALLIPCVLFGLLAAKTYALRRILMSIRRKGYNFRTVLLVGSGEPLRRFIHQLQTHSIWGLRIVGVISDRTISAEDAPGEDVLGHPVIGGLDELPQALVDRQIDEVIFTPSVATLEGLNPAMEICEEMGIRTHLPLNFFQGAIARPAIDLFDDIPVVSYWPTREIGPALLFKYAFDRLFGVLAILAASPILLITIALIKLTSRPGEPIFFGQKRCGLNGRIFTCWKFRTMSVDAEARKGELAAMNEVDGPVFKIKHDPRITPVGRWLRKFSIDELPQFWNVVIGDMSVVGPRPPLPDEVRKYDRWQRRRLSMKPGITCLWQVMGRNHLSFETWMKLDLEYIDNWSLLLDAKILVRTVFVVITGYGAM